MGQRHGVAGEGIHNRGALDVGSDYDSMLVQIQ